MFRQNYEGGGGSPSSEMEQAVMGVLRATKDLRQQLSTTTMEQAGDLGQVIKAGQELVSMIRNFALANDIERLQESSGRLQEYTEHILEVSSPAARQRVRSPPPNSKSADERVLPDKILASVRIKEQQVSHQVHSINQPVTFCPLFSCVQKGSFETRPLAEKSVIRRLSEKVCLRAQSHNAYLCTGQANAVALI